MLKIMLQESVNFSQNSYKSLIVLMAVLHLSSMWNERISIVMDLSLLCFSSRPCLDWPICTPSTLVSITEYKIVFLFSLSLSFLCA